MKNTTSSFLNYEIWILTFQGAFQRAGAYKASLDEEKKTDFKNELKKLVEEIVFPLYKKSISENRHIEHIQKIVVFSRQHSFLFRKGELTFGVAQKLLNLYLKYNWCLGLIAEPPHFPVDRIIQNVIIQQNTRVKIRMVNWTTMNQKDYCAIIDAAKAIKGVLSLATWELENFKRR